MRRWFLLSLVVVLVAAAAVWLTRGRGGDGGSGDLAAAPAEPARLLPLEVVASDPAPAPASDPSEIEAAPAVSLPPQEGDSDVPVLLEEGWSRLRERDVVAAEAAFARVVREGVGGAAVESARDGLAVVALANGERALTERRLAEGSARRPTRIRLLVSLAEDDVRRGDAPAAARALTEAIEGSIGGGAGFAELRPLVEALDAVNRDVFFDPRGTFRSEVVEVASSDSYHKIAKRLAREKQIRIGVGLLRALNRRTGDHLDVGERLRVPSDPIRIEIHRPAFACLVYLGDWLLRAYPVGLGKDGSETPAGSFEVGKKDPRPIWWRPDPPGPPLPYGHPDNPLGERWIGFRAEGRDTDYGIHGTNSEDAILAKVSNGCVRLRNEDVVELFDWIPDSGTPVTIH
jgi:hypothetical protein